MADDPGASIAVFGAAGRMGSAIIEVIDADPHARLGAAVERDGHERCGQTVGDDVAISAAGKTDYSGCDALVAFPTAAGVEAAVAAATTNNLALAIGTTGLDEQHRQLLDQAAQSIAVLHAPNMSLGIHVLCKLVDTAARLLPNWDPEVLELHHRDKLDAPSGTGDRLGQVVRDARGRNEPFSADRTGRSARRPDDEIGMLSLRGGDAAGDHTVMLLGDGERLELVHRAHSRRTFAAGAVQAAKWLAGRPAGSYTLDQMLDA